MLYFIIYGGKTSYVFVVGSRFFALGTTLGNGGLLGGEVNSQAKAFDEGVVIHISAFFLSYEE